MRLISSCPASSALLLIRDRQLYRKWGLICACRAFSSASRSRILF